MWHQYVGLLITRAALPLVGIALAVILILSAALWWTNSRMGTVQARLAYALADVQACVTANRRAAETIAELQIAQAENRAQRERELKRQAEAIQRVEQLETKLAQRETVERVIRVADGDLCAATDIPDRLRRAAERRD